MAREPGALDGTRRYRNRGSVRQSGIVPEGGKLPDQRGSRTVRTLQASDFRRCVGDWGCYMSPTLRGRGWIRNAWRVCDNNSPLSFRRPWIWLRWRVRARATDRLEPSGRPTSGAPSAPCRCGPARARESGPARARESGPERARESGPARACESGPARALGCGPERARQSGPARACESGPARAHQSGPARVCPCGPVWAHRSGPAWPGRLQPRAHPATLNAAAPR